MSCPTRLVAALSPRKPGFDLMSVRVKFVVDDLQMRQVYLRALRSSCVKLIPPMHPTYLHPHVARTRRPNGESLGKFGKTFLFWKSRSNLYKSTVTLFHSYNKTNEMHKFLKFIFGL